MSGPLPPTVRVVRHPLLAHRLALLRDRATPRAAFRRLLGEAYEALGWEALRDLAVTPARRQTPLASAATEECEPASVLLVPVLRAGLAALPALERLLPGAPVGFVGVVRDEQTHEPHEYLVNLPRDPGGPVLVLDPMLATGGTAVHVLDVLARHGMGRPRVRFLALVTAPEGLRRLHEAHPDVPVLAATVDERLNDAAEIVPGLGDAGDRLFGPPR